MRLVHLYLGTFIAPSLLFFAFTGALQVFSLHETTRGSNYVPPRWAVVLGQIHKKQTAIVPVRNPPPPGARRSDAPDARRADTPDAKKADSPAAGGPRAAEPSAPPPTPQKARHPLPLKIFFALVSVGLLSSVISGIYMSYKYTRPKVVISLLLVAGTLIPIALVFV